MLISMYFNEPREIYETRCGVNYLREILDEKLEEGGGKCELGSITRAANLLNAIQCEIGKEARERGIKYDNAHRAYLDRLDELKKTDPVLSEQIQVMKANDDGTPRPHLDFDL